MLPDIHKSLPPNTKPLKSEFVIPGRLQYLLCLASTVSPNITPNKPFVILLITCTSSNGCHSLTEYAKMPVEVDGVVKSAGCAKTGKMLNDWPMPNPDGIKYDGSATNFDDSSDCNLYLAWTQGDNYWIAFARDASNHPMGGILPQNRSALSPPGVFSLGTGGWTMTITEATSDFTPESPPDNSGLSFVWAQSGGEEGEVAWASNYAFDDSNDGNQGGCTYSVDPTKPQKSQGGMVGMRYWQCPFLCSISHK